MKILLCSGTLAVLVFCGAFYSTETAKAMQVYRSPGQHEVDNQKSADELDNIQDRLRIDESKNLPERVASIEATLALVVKLIVALLGGVITLLVKETADLLQRRV